MGQSFCKDCFAAVDIGSHSTRMLVVQKNGTELVPVRSERRTTRLAQDFQNSGEITEQVQQRNLAAMKEYFSILEEFQVAGIACGATGVVRRAKNSASVVAGIAAETGIECQILSEEAESILSAKGILSALPAVSETSGELLTFDVGGGSTEFFFAVQGPDTPISNASRPVGAATLTEAFLKDDPPGAEAVEQAMLAARDEIISAKEQIYENIHNSGIIPFSAKLLLVPCLISFALNNGKIKLTLKIIVFNPLIC